MAYKVKIDLNNIPAFCQKIQALDFDVDAKHGRYTIDAKSLMGFYALDISSPITIEPASNDITLAQAEALKEAVKEYEV